VGGAYKEDVSIWLGRFCIRMSIWKILLVLCGTVYAPRGILSLYGIEGEDGKKVGIDSGGK